jgi:hypothetical protein
LSAIEKGGSLGYPKVNLVGYGVQGKAPLDVRLSPSVYHHSTALRELQENPAWQPHRYKEGKKTPPGKLTKFRPPSASLGSSHILAAAELESLHRKDHDFMESVYTLRSTVHAHDKTKNTQHLRTRRSVFLTRSLYANVQIKEEQEIHDNRQHNIHQHDARRGEGGIRTPKRHNNQKTKHSGCRPVATIN